jgi:hypothetical protein
MANTKHGPEFEIEVGGEPYVWRLHRRPGWSSDAKARFGMAVAVRHQLGKREAVVEFPPVQESKFGAPQLRPEQIDVELVATAITSAIAAGWEPLSRGKTIAIVVDADGG